MSPSDLDVQARFALGLRDAVDRLSRVVSQIRSVRAQLQLRRTALERHSAAVSWVKAAGDLVGKCDALEAKLHNPEAQVEYDILAKGSRLYSRLAPLLVFSTSDDGAPTQGMREVAKELTAELDRLEGEWKGLVDADLAALARQARELNLGDVVVPAP